MDGERKTLKQKAVHEFKKFIWISLYLCVFFWMFIVYKSIILRAQEIDLVAHGVAIINALVLAKFMLIAEAFRPGRQVDNAPLIYPTLLKSAIFALVLMVCKILEDGAVGYFHGESFYGSIALGGGSWKALFVFTVMLFIVLIPLTAFGELGRVVGEGRLSGLFLRQRDVSKPFGQPVV